MFSAHGPVQEGDNLPAGAGVVGAEGRVACTGGNAIFYRPCNGLSVGGAGGDVGESTIRRHNDEIILIVHQYSGSRRILPASMYYTHSSIHIKEVYKVKNAVAVHFVVIA